MEEQEEIKEAEPQAPSPRNPDDSGDAFRSLMLKHLQAITQEVDRLAERVARIGEKVDSLVTQIKEPETAPPHPTIITNAEAAPQTPSDTPSHTCFSKGCDQPVAFEYIWPNSPAAFACQAHAEELERSAVHLNAPILFRKL